MWDPTCGFPGEGPSSSGLRPLSTNSHPFLSKARFALTRGSKEKDHLHGLSPGVSNEFIEGVLENLAAAGNSARPRGSIINGVACVVVRSAAII